MSDVERIGVLAYLRELMRSIAVALLLPRIEATVLPPHYA